MKAVKVVTRLDTYHTFFESHELLAVIAERAYAEHKLTSTEARDRVTLVITQCKEGSPEYPVNKWTASLEIRRTMVND